MMRNYLPHLLLVSGACLLSACEEPACIDNTKPDTETVAQAPSVTIAATVKELMVGAIEPASNAIWAIGMDENMPQSESDWQALENEVFQMMAATAAISLGGSGANDNAWAKQDAWQLMTQQMATISSDILTAVRARDYDATLEASNYLIEPCGACHSAFPGESSL
ncbi:hypothetical protein NBRC116494_03990 [Aurantivibrio plasticivorans]